jgi:hypothetical protein
MFPELARARQAVRKGDWPAALGRLLGILLYACQEDGWIADNEVYAWGDNRFNKWFTEYGAAWRAVLRREDREAGLEVEGGREGGYRETLITLMQGWGDQLGMHLVSPFRWEQATNKLLDDIYDGEAKVQVTRAVKKEPRKKGAEDGAPAAKKKKSS